MIFQATWQQVLAGTKTQTRRIVKPGDVLVERPNEGDLFCWDGGRMNAIYPADLLCNGRRKRGTGHTYAVQPGRSKSAIWIDPEGKIVLDPVAEFMRLSGLPGGTRAFRWLRKHGYHDARIRIVAIRQEQLQDITEEDVLAEGVALQAWAGHDHDWPHTAGYAALWDSIHTKHGERWADNPPVWVLEFELVEAA